MQRMNIFIINFNNDYFFKYLHDFIKNVKIIIVLNTKEILGGFLKWQTDLF